MALRPVSRPGRLFLRPTYPGNVEVAIYRLPSPHLEYARCGQARPMHEIWSQPSFDEWRETDGHLFQRHLAVDRLSIGVETRPDGQFGYQLSVKPSPVALSRPGAAVTCEPLVICIASGESAEIGAV